MASYGNSGGGSTDRTALMASGMSLIAGIGTGIYNRNQQVQQNISDREFQKWFYNQQLADSRQDWWTQFNAQNEYNSPEAQMNRFRQAKLNPHLIYGHGAESTAPAMRGASPPSTSQPAPEFRGNPIADSINAYNDVAFRRAQTDNVYAQTELLAKESLQKDAQTANILQSTAKTKQDYDLIADMKDQIVLKSRLDNEKTVADTEYSKSSLHVQLDRNERERLANSANISKTMQDILESRMRVAKGNDERSNLAEMIKNAQKEGELKELDLRLRRQGINPTDPTWMRVVTQWLTGGAHPMLRMSYESNRKSEKSRDYRGFGRIYQGLPSR